MAANIRYERENILSDVSCETIRDVFLIAAASSGAANHAKSHVPLLYWNKLMDKNVRTFNVLRVKTTNNKDLFSSISPDHIILSLKGKKKETIINELLDILTAQGKLLNRDTALKDVLDREQTMSTAIPNGIAIPRAKTNAVQELTVAIGIKKSGVDFDSVLDDKTRIIILALAPPDKAKPFYKFLLAITTVLNDDTLRSKILTAKSPAEVVELLHKYHQHITPKG
jgi:mannitol/fructose-specific phosphotransferase system IIA component (Ntr-type)